MPTNRTWIVSMHPVPAVGQRMHSVAQLPDARLVAAAPPVGRQCSRTSVNEAHVSARRLWKIYQTHINQPKIALLLSFSLSFPKPNQKNICFSPTGKCCAPP